MIWPRKQPRPTDEQERLSEASAAFLRAVTEQLESNAHRLRALATELEEVTAERRLTRTEDERAE